MNKLNCKRVILILILSLNISLSSSAAITVQGVKLFKDGNLCIKNSSGTEEKLDLSTLIVNDDSVEGRLSSSGSLCTPPPIFTGGANLTSSSQANPVVQGLGRGILISESGEINAFSMLLTSFGGISNVYFEIELPSGCDVVDDDNDTVGSSSDLTTINDFTFHTCTASSGITATCNSASGAFLDAASGLVPATVDSPAKIRFIISDTLTSSDGVMLDSILIKFDSQDIFCPSTATGELLATVYAKKIGTSDSTTLGTANIGTPVSAASFNYVTSSVTSTKGETSTNEVGVTPVLLNANSTTLNPIVIEELNEESIPIGGQSSPNLLNPPISQSPITANENLELWIIPTSKSFFKTAPSTSDIEFSDNSITVSSSPYLVVDNSTHSSAPYGTLIIPITLNTESGAIDPATVKTKITINNVIISKISSSDTTATVSLGFFESISGALVNAPGAISIHNTNVTTNPQNFSSFAPSTTRAQNQNVILNTNSAPSTSFANQISTDENLILLTARNEELGASQIKNLISIVSEVTSLDENKVEAEINDSTKIITITGQAGASIGGASVTIESFTNNSSTAFDSTVITSKSDGSFTAKLKGENSSSTQVKLKQSVSSSESQLITKSVVILVVDPPIIEPTVSAVVQYINENGGLSTIISQGGVVLQAVINALKEALGIT